MVLAVTRSAEFNYFVNTRV